MQLPPRTADTEIFCNGETFKLHLESSEIQARVREIGRQIAAEYSKKRPILIGVLNGAFIFTADLIRAVGIDCEVDFIKLSSYGAEKVTSGKVTELKRIDADIRNRHVIVIEDIVDTGHSIQFIVDRLSEEEPASIAVAAMFHKAEATIVDVSIDYVGFTIPNAFVIGYGLDYGQLGRNLGALYIEASYQE